MSSHTPNTPIEPLQRPAHIAIVVADWNGHITSELCNGALNTLLDNSIGVNTVEVFHVPGTIELTYAAARLIQSHKFDAVIVFGCVVRGATPHFDYVCQSVTQGVTLLNATTSTPVIFGVLTVDNDQQALDRIGGPDGHKGVEAAQAAVQMIHLRRSIPSINS